MFSVLCKFLSHGKKFSVEDVPRSSFGFSEHISCEYFFPRLKKLPRTWETLWGPTYPVGVEGWDDQVSLDLQWFIHVLRICSRWRLFFQNSKRLIVRKNHIWDPFSHRRGMDGIIICIPILISSFRFPEYIPRENFLPKLKNSQIRLYHHGCLFTLQLGWGWDDGLRLDLKWFNRAFQTFFSSKFFPNPKNSGSMQKAIIYGSFPHRRSGDTVIGWIPISNCLVEYW